MKIYDHRPPLVKKNPFLHAAIVFAYSEANLQDRDKYVQVLKSTDDSTDNNEANYPAGMSVQNGVETTAESSQCLPDSMSLTELPRLCSVLVTFPPHNSLKTYGWKQVEIRKPKNREMLYLNPILLDKLDLARSGFDKARIIVIIHCVVCHELAHLLHYKKYNSTDKYFQTNENGSRTGVDCGTEVEHLIYGGRMLSTPDLSALRIERKNGEVYDLDFCYFYREFLESDRRKIDFGILSKVNPDTDGSGQRWIGMGEINGTHDV
jgi:hypothetical protein